MQKIGEIYAIRTPDVVYIGSALGSSLSPWSSHLRLLKAGKHHCSTLQRSFMNDPTCLTFQILEMKIEQHDLPDRERFWTRKLNGVNALPGRFVRQEKNELIAERIKAGMTYREISGELGVSLGKVAKVKTQFGL